MLPHFVQERMITIWHINCAKIRTSLNNCLRSSSVTLFGRSATKTVEFSRSLWAVTFSVHNSRGITRIKKSTNLLGGGPFCSRSGVSIFFAHQVSKSYNTNSCLFMTFGRRIILCSTFGATFRWWWGILREINLWLRRNLRTGCRSLHVGLHLYRNLISFCSFLWP